MSSMRAEVRSWPEAPVSATKNATSMGGVLFCAVRQSEFNTKPPKAVEPDYVCFCQERTWPDSQGTGESGHDRSFREQGPMTAMG
jgi:hypothetical protein